MRFEKLAFNFMVECGGKLAKSLLCSKPISKPINFKGLKYVPVQSNIEKIVSSNTNCRGIKLWDINLKRGKNEAILRSCHIEQSEIPPECCLPPDYIKDGKLNALVVGVLKSTGGGMGTEAIKEAVKLSHHIGQDGRLALAAFQIDAKKGNPIPFYYKIGFKSVIPKEQLEIEKGMADFYKRGEYTGPEASVMFLPKERINDILSGISLLF